jgi:chromate reductase
MTKRMSMHKRVKILGFAGSLRRNSFNRLLLRTAAKLLPNSAELEILDLDGIPLYNQDIEVVGIPESVRKFKNKIEGADAILIATPEYNHAYPVVLKNAIDWASRPYGQNSFAGKPVAVISASPGMLGGVAAQDQLKQVLLWLDMHIVPQPAVLVTSAHDKIDSEGNVTDPATREFLQKLLANLVRYTEKLTQPKAIVITPKISMQ